MPSPFSITDFLSRNDFRFLLEREILPAWLPRRRWFRSKSRAIRSVAVEAAVPLNAGTSALAIARIDFADNGEPERYALPLALVGPQQAATLPEESVLGPVITPAGECLLIDACHDADFRAALFDLLSGKTEAKGGGGGLRPLDRLEGGQAQGGALRGHPASPGFPAVPGVSRLYAGEQSNTSFSFGSEISVKLYRRLEEGIHPEPEMLRFLRERTDYRHVPDFLSSLEWTPDGGAPITVALAQEFVANGADAWEYAREKLRAALRDPGDPDAGVPEDLRKWAALLGTRVGELHAALGSRADVPDFAPEPLSAADVEAVRSKTRALLDVALAALEAGAAAAPPETAALARAVLAGRARLEILIENAGRGAATGRKIRTHGDLHLGQILTADGDAIRILDFEGEPGRTLAEARMKQSPLRDAAGMLRSFHYAAHAAARAGARESGGAAAPPADRAAGTLGAAFLEGYFAAVRDSGLPGAGEGDLRGLLDLFVLEKAVYELHYENNNRPDWREIPLRGLVTLCNLPL